MPSSIYESIDLSSDFKVELHLFWNSAYQYVDVAVYFDELPLTKKVMLDGPPISEPDPNGDETTTYTFKLVDRSTPGSFYYFDDEIYGRPHQVTAKIKTIASSQAQTTAL